MIEREAAVALQRLEGLINLQMGEIKALLEKLEFYVESHAHEHAMLAQAIVAARSELTRDLHTLNGLKLEMDKERNLLADKGSVIALDQKVQQAMATARDRATQGDDALDKRITEVKEHAATKMAELESKLNASLSTTGGEEAGSAKANAAWIGAIFLALALLAAFVKYVLDK